MIVFAELDACPGFGKLYGDVRMSGMCCRDDVCSKSIGPNRLKAQFFFNLYAYTYILGGIFFLNETRVADKLGGDARDLFLYLALPLPPPCTPCLILSMFLSKHAYWEQMLHFCISMYIVCYLFNHFPLRSKSLSRSSPCYAPAIPLNHLVWLPALPSRRFRRAAVRLYSSPPPPTRSYMPVRWSLCH